MRLSGVSRAGLAGCCVDWIRVVCCCFASVCPRVATARRPCDSRAVQQPVRLKPSPVPMDCLDSCRVRLVAPTRPSRILACLAVGSGSGFWLLELSLLACGLVFALALASGLWSFLSCWWFAVGSGFCPLKFALGFVFCVWRPQ